MVMSEQPEVPLSMEDVCRLLNVQRSQLYKLIRTGRFPRPRRIGGKSAYLREDWDAYLVLAGRWEPGPFGGDAGGKGSDADEVGRNLKK